jgi:lipoate-protein ligase A
MEAMHDRFRDRGRLLAQALESLGVDARVGEVPGEYCSGPYSVNLRGEVKVVGTAQRVVREGWLFATVITVTGTAALRAALVDVYEALGIEMDPRTVAGVADDAPGVDVAAVQRAVVDAYQSVYELAPAELPPDVEAAAERGREQHRVA